MKIKLLATTLVVLLAGSYGLQAMQQEEYSLADFIEDHGQPRVLDGVLALSGWTLSLVGSKKLTSLEGIALLEHPEAIIKLHLSGNLLKTIPSQIRLLRNLQALYLGDNQLESLTSAIGDLRQLQILNLSYNQLETLPTLKNIKDLKELYLRGNPLPGITREILIRDYLGGRQDIEIWLGEPTE